MDLAKARFAMILNLLSFVDRSRGLHLHNMDIGISQNGAARLSGRGGSHAGSLYRLPALVLAASVLASGWLGRGLISAQPNSDGREFDEG
jgi:hypothetical protein